MGTPERAIDVLRQFIGPTDREHLVVMLLDHRGAILGVHTVSIGTMTVSLVHPLEVFKPAIMSRAAALILCHNHPSGVARPSSQDRNTTRRIAQAGKLLCIPLVDHIILGEGYFSFREAGFLS